VRGREQVLELFGNSIEFKNKKLVDKERRGIAKKVIKKSISGKVKRHRR
jgi:hypothetical protein